MPGPGGFGEGESEPDASRSLGAEVVVGSNPTTELPCADFSGVVVVGQQLL